MTARCVAGCVSSRASARGGATAARTRRCCQEGWEVNRKRVQRLWREEGLRVPVRRRKRRRLGNSTVPAARLSRRAPRSRVGDRLPVRPDRRRQDPEAAARRRRVHPRGARVECRRRIDADRTVAVLDRIVCRPWPRRQSSSAATTARSSPPTRCGTGAASPAPAALHRARVSRGRTPTSSPSARASATSCSPSSCSPAWPRRRSWSRTGARTTTSTARTQRSA